MERGFLAGTQMHMSSRPSSANLSSSGRSYSRESLRPTDTILRPDNDGSHKRPASATDRGLLHNNSNSSLNGGRDITADTALSARRRKSLGTNHGHHAPSTYHFAYGSNA